MEQKVSALVKQFKTYQIVLFIGEFTNKLNTQNSKHIKINLRVKLLRTIYCSFFIIWDPNLKYTFRIFE